MAEKVNHERVLEFLCMCEYVRIWVLPVCLLLGSNGVSLRVEEFCVHCGGQLPCVKIWLLLTPISTIRSPILCLRKWTVLGVLKFWSVLKVKTVCSVSLICTCMKACCHQRSYLWWRCLMLSPVHSLCTV